MKSFLYYIGDAIRYALSDRKGIVLISALMAVTSFVNKDPDVPRVVVMFNLTMILVMGYGSYVSWHTLRGSDEHPHVEGRVKKLLWEGFKKTVITVIYSFVMAVIGTLGKHFLSEGNFILVIVCVILFSVTYIIFIGGLLNRYLHRGEFTNAFDFPEIFKLVSLFDLATFLKVVAAVIISQTFALSVIIGFSDGFSMTELVFSIASFFLAPFLYIANKRLVGLNVRDLLLKNEIIVERVE